MNKTNKKIKLYILIPNLNMGGAERVVVTLLRFLDINKFDCNLVVLTGKDGVLSENIPKNISITWLKKSRVLFSFPILLKLLWKKRPQILFSNLSYLNLLLATIRFLLPKNTKIIVRESSLISINNLEYRFEIIWRYFYKIFYKNVDLIICQSKEMQNDIIQNFCVPADKTVKIFNPVDVKFIKSKSKYKLNEIKKHFHPDHFNFIYVGALRKQKHVDRILFALSKINNIYLHVIGNGTEMSELIALSQRLRLNQRINFVGFQANPYRWLKLADALILSSDFEGLPNVVLEALALKIPVISTSAPGGVCEILKDQKGCVISDDLTSQSLEKAILTWINMKKRKVSQNTINKYRAEYITPLYEKQFLSLIK